MNSRIPEIKQSVRIPQYLEGIGVVLKRSGGELKCNCPMPDHNDTNASFYVEERDNVFFCHGCGAKGSIVDLVIGIDRLTTGEAVLKLEQYLGGEYIPSKIPVVNEVKEPSAPPVLQDEYVYRKPNGDPAFFVQRLMCSDGKKTFRQGHYNEQGGRILSMKGVERLPYNLDKFREAETIWLAEGEKCAEALCLVGLLGTCTVGGSGNWLDSYAMYFAEKDVVILPDFDDAGEEYAKDASEALEHVAKSVRVLRVGMAGLPKGYDIADYIAKLSEEVADEPEAEKLINAEIVRRMEQTPRRVKGFELDVVSIYDMRRKYAASKSTISGKSFSIAEHISSLKGVVRDFKTGDCICVKGPTGSAKTMFVQNIARWARPLNVLIFEPELAVEDMFERWAAMELDDDMANVYERMSRVGDITLEEGLDHVYVCPCSSPNPRTIEETINRSELIIGARPDMVIVDYIQLVQWMDKCSRYERFSNIAESFRVLPNTTRTMFMFISQVHRPEKQGGKNEATRYDAKESGSIENSSTLMIDIRAGENSNEKIITVVKDTHSQSEGLSAPVGFEGNKGRFCDPFSKMDDVFV